VRVVFVFAGDVLKFGTYGSLTIRHL
jgi:hypothetical protein